MSEHSPSAPESEPVIGSESRDPDARLRASLGSLPRLSARSGFTRRVLARLPEAGSEDRSPAAFDLRWALAAALAFAVAVVFVAGERAERSAGAPSDPAELQARIESLRQEQRALAAELQYLEALADGGLEPVLVIRDGDQTDLLVDLRLTADTTQQDFEGVPR